MLITLWEKNCRLTFCDECFVNILEQVEVRKLPHQN